MACMLSCATTGYSDTDVHLLRPPVIVHFRSDTITLLPSGELIIVILSVHGETLFISIIVQEYPVEQK